MIDITSVQEEKQNTRTAVLAARREFMSGCDAPKLVAPIFDKIQELMEFRMAQNVMAYASQDDELPLYDFLALAQKLDKTVYLPGRGKKKYGMDAVRLPELAKMPAPPWGFWWEEGKRVPPTELDFIIVPGVAFSLQGDRLGSGCGYYDRFLKRADTAYRLGVAWECQLKDTLPTEPHDIKMHAILTESRFIET